MTRTLVAALLAVVVCYAAANDQQPDSDTQVPLGFARLFLLRPGFSEVSREDKPLLSINGIEVVRLTYNSYTSVLLKPGNYEIVTLPGSNEPSFWESRFTMSAEPGKSYFLAIWNDVSIVGRSSATQFIGTQGVVGAVVALAIENNQSVAVRHELVAAPDAAAVMKDMTYMRPQKEQLEP